MAKELSRRDFLKLAGVGAGVLTIPDSLLSLGTADRKRDDVAERTIEKIQEVLGLTPDQVTLAWAFGMHVVTDGFVRHQLNDRPGAIVIGEFAADELIGDLSYHDGDNVPGRSTWDAILYPGEGANEKAFRRHKELVQELVARGYTFVTSDANSVQKLDEDGTKHVDIASAASEGVVVGSLVTLAKMVWDSQHREESDDIVIDEDPGEVYEEPNNHGRLVAGATGALVGTLIGGASMIGQSIQSGNRYVNPENSLVNATNDIDVTLERWFTKDPIFVRYIEGILTLRNLIMALNTWHTLDLTEPAAGIPRQLVFFAGGAHIKSYEKFIEGPYALMDELRTYARLITHDVVDTLMTGRDASGNLKNEVDIAQDLLGYAQMFSDPYKIGRAAVLEPEFRHKDIHSAATLMWEEVAVRVGELAGATSQDDVRRLKTLQILQIMLLRTASMYSKKIWKSTLGYLEQIDEPIITGNISPSTQYVSADVYTSLNPAWYWVQEKLLVGKSNYFGNNKLYSVLRAFILQDGAIETLDCIELPDFEQAYGDSSLIYEPVTDISEMAGQKVLRLSGVDEYGFFTTGEFIPAPTTPIVGATYYRLAQSDPADMGIRYIMYQ